MRRLKIFIVLSFFLALLSNFNHTQAQISRMRQQSSGEDNNDQETTTKTTDDKSGASPDTAVVRFYFLNPEASYTLEANKAKLHNFHQYTPIQKTEEYYLSLGTTGSASLPITFTTSAFNGFRFIHNAFSLYKINLDSIPLFVPEKPYSEINYMMGRGKEQQLLFTLTQQIRKGLYLGLNARYLSAPGLYQRQRNYYSTGFFTLSYTIPSKRYGFRAVYLNDRFRNYENGGLQYDTVFRDNTESNRKTIAINLTDATNRDRNSGIILTQFVNLQKKATLGADSTRKKSTAKFDAGRFIHTLKYNRNTYSFEDNQGYLHSLSGYYPSTFGDSTLTYDSTYHIHLENTLVYSNLEPDTLAHAFPFQYTFGISYQIDWVGYTSITGQVNPLLTPYFSSASEKVSTYGQKAEFRQWLPFGTLKGIIARKTFFIASAKLAVGGYNSGDHELTGTFYQLFRLKDNTAKIYLVLTQRLQHPDYFYHTYYSNHYRWDNSLLSQDYLIGKAGIDMAGYNLSFSSIRISNYTWLNSSSQPQQAKGGVAILRGDFNKVFRPGRWVLDTRFAFQKVNNDTVLKLPTFTSKVSLSYTLLLFKKVLLAEVGVSCQYFTEFYADAYNPELRMFYRQDIQKTGNYPFLDAFINMRIKRARLFIKYEHFNAGFMGYTYYLIPHYPGADASFKAGVSWMFYD